MSLKIQSSDWFLADLERQVDWYREEAGSEVAEQFVSSVQATLQILARTPGLGRPRFQDRPELAGMRSFRVQRPFHRLLVFYRHNRSTISMERLIHGARDLPRRLRESPFSEPI